MSRKWSWEVNDAITANFGGRLLITLTRKTWVAFRRLLRMYPVFRRPAGACHVFPGVVHRWGSCVCRRSGLEFGLNLKTARRTCRFGAVAFGDRPSKYHPSLGQSLHRWESLSKRWGRM